MTEITPAATTTGSQEVESRRSRHTVVVGGKTFFLGTGRRKSSVARVRITAGQGAFTVNDRKLDEFFREAKDRSAVVAPLSTASAADKLDVFVNVQGGGYSGQAGAIVQGLGRALSLYDATLRKPIQDAGFLTRDSRMKERKKYGLRGARRAFQFSKR